MTLLQAVRIVVPAMAALAAMWVTASKAGDGVDEKFLAENNVAMSRMMAGMSVPSSGDVDRDFVAMMVPHHQGAVDMALAELRYGRNEKLRRIAQEIVVDQQAEIAAMNLAIGQGLPSAPPGHGPTPTMREDDMSMPVKP